jgi:hypothetical protein
MGARNGNALKVGLGILSVLASQACGSHRGVRLANDGGAGADGGAPFAGADGRPGFEAGGGSPAVDAGGCRGLEIPDVDCPLGTPNYVCVERQGGWAWDFTCSQPPQDAAARVDSVAVPSADCQAVVDRLRREMTLSVLGACTAVVLLEFESLKILSYALVCGKYASVSEASARSAANTVTYPPMSTKAGSGDLLSGSAPPGQWVFYTRPSDFGGAASVSAHTGLVTFAGTINWIGGGEIQQPKTWSTADLGEDCFTPHPRDTRTFDLSGGQADPSKANPGMQEATRIVHSTALPTAFQYLGTVYGTTVLLYPRAVGSFDPKTAQFIVLLDGGWLE